MECFFGYTVQLSNTHHLGGKNPLTLTQKITNEFLATFYFHGKLTQVGLHTFINGPIYFEELLIYDVSN